MSPEQINFVLLGALIAVALVLLAATAAGGYLVLRGLNYVARFKGLQASRQGGSLSFGGIVDETPRVPKPSLFEEATTTEEAGEPIPASELT